jgi:hypothetical protein
MDAVAKRERHDVPNTTNFSGLYNQDSSVLETLTDHVASRNNSARTILALWISISIRSITANPSFPPLSAKSTIFESRQDCRYLSDWKCQLSCV